MTPRRRRTTSTRRGRPARSATRLRLAGAWQAQLAALAGAAEFLPWQRPDPQFEPRLSGFLATATGVKHVTVLVDTLRGVPVTSSAGSRPQVTAVTAPVTATTVTESGQQVEIRSGVGRWGSGLHKPFQRPRGRRIPLPDWCCFSTRRSVQTSQDMLEP